MVSRYNTYHHFTSEALVQEQAHGGQHLPGLRLDQPAPDPTPVHLHQRSLRRLLLEAGREAQPIEQGPRGLFRVDSRHQAREESRR